MQERRRYKRVEANLPIKVSADEFDIVTQTKNISGSGAYCSTDNKNLEVMSKLDLVLLVPCKGKKGNIIKKVNCKGVVVRTDQAQDKKAVTNKNYIAIFFNEITEKNRKIITSYVDSCQHKDTSK